MFRRYHHGHSIGVGVLVGVLLERHLFAALLVAFLVGVVAGRTWQFWAHIGHAARRGITRSRPQKIRTEPEPVYRGDGIPF